MHPVLTELNRIDFHLYGAIVAASFLAGISLTRREAGERGLALDVFPGLAFTSLMYTLLGARALYVAAYPHLYVEHPYQALMVWKGGLLFQGGAAAGAAGAGSYLLSRGRPLRAWADAAAPGLALGQSIGGLACLAASCAQKLTAEAPWLFMHRASSQSFLDRMPPAQLAQVVTGLGIFLLLMELKPHLKAPGRLMGVCLSLSSLFWLSANFLQPGVVDHTGLLIFHQALALAFLCTGLWLLFNQRSM